MSTTTSAIAGSRSSSADPRATRPPAPTPAPPVVPLWCTPVDMGAAAAAAAAASSASLPTKFSSCDNLMLMRVGGNKT